MSALEAQAVPSEIRISSNRSFEFFVDKARKSLQTHPEVTLSGLGNGTWGHRTGTAQLSADKGLGSPQRLPRFLLC